MKGELRLTIVLPADGGQDWRRRVKSKAAAEGKTLRQVVTELLEAWLADK